MKDRWDAERAETPEVCECGTPVDAHPPLPEPLPWSHGRPCGRRAEGQFASGSSFLVRNVRPAPTAEPVR